MLDFGYYNMDCMDGMKEFPDKYFDLDVVDPPYFTGPEKRGFYGRKVSPIGVKMVYRVSAEWKIPEKEYFDELIRVSKNQIIWGCNYFKYVFYRDGLCGTNAMETLIFQTVKSQPAVFMTVCAFSGTCGTE